MQKTALITGITGQDGSYLAELLLAKGYRVVGMKRRSSSRTTSRIRHLIDLELIEGDVTDYHSVSSIIRAIKPDEIYNLAAQSHVATSFEQPAYTAAVNYGGVINVLEAIRAEAPKTRFYQASTSEMFGSSTTTSYPASLFEIGQLTKYEDAVYRIQNETTPFLPNSPYASAKLAAHHACRIYREAYGIHASSGILFNHESPRRGDEFVTRKITTYIAKQVAIKGKGLTGFVPLQLGNLDASRDWGHAKDYVRAMWLMLQQPKADDYVISTGETHTVREFFTAAMAAAGLDGSIETWTTTNPSLYRPCEVPYLRGDSSKARNVLGWSPEINFKNLVAQMVCEDIKQERLK